MIRATLTATAFALCAPVRAESVIPEIDPIAQAEKTCQVLNNPSLDQSVKDRLIAVVYVASAEPLSADASDILKAMWEANAIVRERGCGK